MASNEAALSRIRFFNWKLASTVSIGVVGDAQVVHGAAARLGDLLALLLQVAAVALGGLGRHLLRVAVGFQRALLVGAVLALQQLRRLALRRW